MQGLCGVCARWLDGKREKGKLRHMLGSGLAAHSRVVSYSDWIWRFAPPSGVCLCLSPEWSHEKDLPSFCELAMRLGSNRQDCESWQKKAARRYRQLSTGADPLALRFTFPHELVAPRQ